MALFLNFLLLCLTTLSHFVRSDLQFTYPTANDTLAGGTHFNLTVVESGIVPLIPDLLGTSIILCAGNILAGNINYLVSKALVAFVLLYSRRLYKDGIVTLVTSLGFSNGVGGYYTEVMLDGALTMDATWTTNGTKEL